MTHGTASWWRGVAFGICVSYLFSFGAAFWFGFSFSDCLNRDHDALVTPSAVVPVHFGTTYTMSCVCSNYPTANPHHRPAPSDDMRCGLQPVEQRLAGDHEVVVVGFGP